MLSIKLLFFYKNLKIEKHVWMFLNFKRFGEDLHRFTFVKPENVFSLFFEDKASLRRFLYL